MSSGLILPNREGTFGVEGDFLFSSSLSPSILSHLFPSCFLMIHFFSLKGTVDKQSQILREMLKQKQERGKEEVSDSGRSKGEAEKEEKSPLESSGERKAISICEK